MAVYLHPAAKYRRLTSRLSQGHKKQQMQWTKRGAHLLLQTRVKTLKGSVRDVCNFSHLRIRPAKFTYLDGPGRFLSH